MFYDSVIIDLSQYCWCLLIFSSLVVWYKTDFCNFYFNFLCPRFRPRSLTSRIVYCAGVNGSLKWNTKSLVAQFQRYFISHWLKLILFFRILTIVVILVLFNVKDVLNKEPETRYLYFIRFVKWNTLKEYTKNYQTIKITYEILFQPFYWWLMYFEKLYSYIYYYAIYFRLEFLISLLTIDFIKYLCIDNTFK